MPTQDPIQTTDILSSDGRPFKTENAAKSTMARKALGTNTHQAHALPNDEGWVIRPIVQPAADSEQVEEKCYMTRFASRSHPNQTEYVELAVNGFVIQAERNVWVPMLGRFLEVAKNGVERRFTQRAGEPRKFVGDVQTYPFETREEIPAAKFWDVYRRGTKMTKEVIKRYGYEATSDKLPEDISLEGVTRG